MYQKANGDKEGRWDAQDLGDVGSGDKSVLMVMRVLYIRFILFS